MEGDQDPVPKRRRVLDTNADESDINVDIVNLGGETVQSLCVPSTLSGQNLLDLIMFDQASPGSVVKLFHGPHPVDTSTPINASPHVIT